MTSDKPSIVNILSVVICDDVRTENTGKDILIGVYGGPIALHAIPSPPLPLRCWINLEVRGPTNISLNFRARDHRGKQLLFSQAQIGTQEEHGLGNISLGPFLYVLTEPEGSLTLDYQEEEGEWKNFLTKPVRYQSK